MAFNNPSVTDFKNQFFRDFPYEQNPMNPNINLYVQDQDISNAFQMVNMNINQGLFADQGSYTVGYNLCAAHYLVSNLIAASQGINGQHNWLQNSKGVGAVNEAFAIPQKIQDNPFYADLSKTNYGQRFLMLIYPQLAGAVFTVCMPARAL